MCQKTWAVLMATGDEYRVKAAMFCCCGPAVAEGFTFGGAGRDYPYPNEPSINTRTPTAAVGP
jgi:hypothetical protein